MLTAADLIALPFTPDLSEGGTAFAIRSIPHLRITSNGSVGDRLRHISAGASVELAFRRHLTSLEVAFSVRGAVPFTEPDRYDVALGGHRCDIQPFLISHRDQITRLRRDPASVLAAHALVLSDRHAADAGSPHDLYVFAFLAGLVAPSPRETEKAIRAGQSICMLYCMPPAWRQPRGWNPLGPLALKSETDEPLVLELSGQNAARGPLSCRVELPPRTRVVVSEPFHSLASIHTEKLVRGRIGVHSPALGGTCLIEPREWENIRVYGMQVLLTGYMTRREFSDRAVQIAPGTRVFQFDHTRARNLAVRVEELHPLGELFERTRAWQAQREKA